MSVSALIQNAQTIVIKVGSVLIREAAEDKIREDWFAALAADVKTLMDQGKRVIIVSSGGVALGRTALGIAHNTPPALIPLEQKQAASAVGQYHMFAAYFKALQVEKLTAAQVLLTMSETENRRMHLNARETLYTLFGKNIVPVINENDTVSTGEIRFGDNDRLAVRVAQMVEADLVILLSTIDGLYTADPTRDTQAQHIPVVEKINDEHVTMAGEAIPGLSTGGMKSKIEAALSATKVGIPLVITNGMPPHILGDLCADKARSTIFKATGDKKNARKTWISSHLSPKGKIYVDQGAGEALLKGKSLLPIGVTRIEGAFTRGDIVKIYNADGQELGTGLAGYNAEDAKKIAGCQSSEIEQALGYLGRKELVHRNDMVLNA